MTTRRQILLAGLGLALGAAGLPLTAEARRKRKPAKPQAAATGMPPGCTPGGRYVLQGGYVNHITWRHDLGRGADCGERGLRRVRLYTDPAWKVEASRGDVTIHMYDPTLGRGAGVSFGAGASFDRTIDLPSGVVAVDATTPSGRGWPDGGTYWCLIRHQRVG